MKVVLAILLALCSISTFSMDKAPSLEQQCKEIIKLQIDQYDRDAICKYASEDFVKCLPKD